MLVLSRKSGESIRIGPNTVIDVLEVQGNRVRLGISAPAGVSIWRGELILEGGTLPVRSSALPDGAHQATAF